MSATYWLIEGTRYEPRRYLCIDQRGHSWITDPSNATRFGSKQAAQLYVNAKDDFWDDCAPFEHMDCSGPDLAAPAAHPAAHQESAIRSDQRAEAEAGVSTCTPQTDLQSAHQTSAHPSDPEQPSAALADELAEWMVVFFEGKLSDAMLGRFLHEHHEAILAALRHPEPTPRGEQSYKFLYEELLYAVGKKYEGETRHKTALRYIRQAEETKPEDRIAREGNGS